MALSVGKAILGLLAVWLVVIVLMTGPLLHSSDNDEHIMRRLTKAVNELDLLKRQNDELRTLLADFKVVSEDGDKSKDQLLQDLQEKLDKANLLFKPDSSNSLLASKSEISNVCDPSKEFELTRRKVIMGVSEMWFYMSAQLKHLQKGLQEEAAVQRVQRILEDGADHRRIILHDLRNLSTIDGLGDWRAREAKSLSDLIQRRLHYLQNPKDCSKAKKLACNLNKGCGYGCQIHHAVYCFIMAYSTERTLILRSKGWRYNQEGWETVFKPVSDTCTDPDGDSRSSWPGQPNTQVVDIPIIDAMNSRPPHLPLAIPSDLADRMIRLHGDPSVWWVAQFLKYLLRPQDGLKSIIDEAAARLGFKRPIVGIHVRRTDKVGTEAAFHAIDEYMGHVEEFYRQLELQKPGVERMVYVASDDPHVLDDARKKFPKYKFLGDPNIAKTASMETRYSDSSLRGIILDIHFLSMCDYLVCTFSSQVCRIAYEIMQAMDPDAANNFRSLDDIYYFGGQNAHNHEAIYPHLPRSTEEIALEVGDLIGIAGNHWDGFSKGMNKRTRQRGLYPSYKARNKIDSANFPTYSEADRQ